jgi:DNA-binding transcriptional ArsR family regulator
MDIESLFIDSKWKILTELGKSSLSPSELAQKTGTSVANISSQLKILEAMEFIEQERLTNVNKGEPRKLYSLKKEFAYIILSTKSSMGKKLIKLDNEVMPFFAIWFINESFAPYLISKLYFNNEAIFREALSYSYLGSNENVFEMLIIHPNPQIVFPINEKQIAWRDKIFKINIHAHTKEVFAAGYNSKEEYFTSVLKKAFILSDRENFLTKLKRGGK